MTTDVASQPEESEEQVEVLLPDTNIVTHCILKNDVERLRKSFEEDEDPYKEIVADLINTRGRDGKSPLDLASTLGRVELARELIVRGAEVNSANLKGYTALHHAAAWGKVSLLKVLVDALSDLQLKTAHGERARETALRYNQTECVDFLDWAEAKSELLDAIKNHQEFLTDPERNQGRLNKEDKNIITNACKEKTEWLENTSDATTQDFISQRQNLDEIITPIIQKLNEPAPEKPEKR
ncbi:ankyrin repeat domain-containing protein 45-like isoform X1 [Crassostrea virginica]|uniref:Ankyrin repeat domain-containing protein 45-like isoform X2 n=1 Tax=Crassostrea virginica TaxID=6565 RepID=A0A8B8CY02_CRAVI|nr:ankyrin repeat domain-containing protein 45-like isoform X2 [Crassostrea virginica]